MKALNQVNVCILAILTVVSYAKDDDEGRPYEFGFTIDGEQHRFEKKDEYGIVQGEFGFITADGTYHVTVYATDENGNFKILSMRNIKINPSHDDGFAEQKQKTFLNKQQSVMTEKSLQHYEYQVSKSSQSITQKPGPYVFTTQSTIKPACGGCGYITRQPSKIKTSTAKESEYSQNSKYTEANLRSMEDYKQGVSRVLAKPEKNEKQSGVTENKSNLLTPNHQQISYGQINILSASTFRPKHEVVIQEVTSSIPSGSQYILGEKVKSYPGVELVPPVLKSPSQERNSNNVTRFPSENNPNSKNVPTEIEQQVERIASTSGFQPNNLKQSDMSMSKLPPVLIIGETIHVGGSKPIDIPIKDKYPGMVNGLPNGVEKHNIEEILYKFHYSVGFHGHYEKGLKNGAKIGGYFVNGRDGISRVVTYIADENGYRPKFKFINLGLDSSDTPKKDTEKQFGLKSFEFIWYPIK